LPSYLKKKHWFPIFFNKTTNYDFILLNKQGRTQLVYSTEHVFEKFGVDFPVALPLVAGSAARLVSIT